MRALCVAFGFGSRYLLGSQLNEAEMSELELPDGYAVECDRDGDWWLVRTPVMLKGADDKAEAVKMALEYLEERRLKTKPPAPPAQSGRDGSGRAGRP